MSKKKTFRKKTSWHPAVPRSRRRLTKPIVAALVVCLIAAGTAATRWAPVRRIIGLAPAPAAPQQSNLALSKEYIYAGGRLVATEEPAPTPAGSPPTNLLATSTSATTVRLMWAAPAGQVTKYKVERRQGGDFVEIAEVAGNPPAVVFDDTGRSPATAYLYQVRAVFSGGGLSTYSNRDLATTVIFEDDPLVAQVTPVRFRHVEQLRTAVDAVRATAGQSEANWSSALPAQQYGPIHAEHIRKLRENLDPALSALGLPEVGTDATLAAGQPVKAAHIQNVREKVK